MPTNSASRLPEKIAERLRLPLIAAPMLRVSGPELVIAACRGGVIGAFPAANARSIEQLDDWMTQIENALAEKTDSERLPAAYCPNLIIRRAELREELGCVLKHKVELVITSVGSPEGVVGPLHDIGCLVFADVATVRHAHKAIAAGSDGLILLTTGAGGNTGWLNPIAFVRAVREFFDGPIVMAGGMSDGAALWAAQVLGCDLAYMGTQFIATNESMAAPEYRQMIVESGIDDIQLTRALTGLETNMLRPSLIAAGLDPVALSDRASPEDAAGRYGRAAKDPGPRRWKDLWSAGHSVSGVKKIQSAAELIDQTEREYREARARTAQLLVDR